ncbi:hypothetical protein BFJ67_g17894 [Fusarium oxysporum f. sp. cepae]|nr:hypothetical protein BFJ67_g17894 [Fusarium oxysporum f. sp. cepae]
MDRKPDSHQRRASEAFSPKWHLPTRSQPYSSFKHIVLDVKAGGPSKVACNRYSIKFIQHIIGTKALYFREGIPSAGTIPLQPRILLHR